MLPITGGSLYHGDWKADITQNVNELRANNPGHGGRVARRHLAVPGDVRPGRRRYNLWIGANPDAGGRRHASPCVPLDFGSARLGYAVEHASPGTLPTSAVLGTGTYVAYNPSGSAITVTFTDGQTLAVPARAMAWRGPAGSGVEPGGGGGPVTPSPTPTTSPSPSPSPSTSLAAGVFEPVER